MVQESFNLVRYRDIKEDPDKDFFSGLCQKGSGSDSLKAQTRGPWDPIVGCSNLKVGVLASMNLGKYSEGISLLFIYKKKKG